MEIEELSCKIAHSGEMSKFHIYDISTSLKSKYIIYPISENGDLTIRIILSYDLVPCKNSKFLISMFPEFHTDKVINVSLQYTAQLSSKKNHNPNTLLQNIFDGMLSKINSDWLIKNSYDNMGFYNGIELVLSKEIQLSIIEQIIKDARKYNIF